MAGRKSKLTPLQWAEVSRRLLANETHRDIADAMGVSKASITAHASAQLPAIKSVVNAIVESDRQLSELPIPAQSVARSFADDVSSISKHLGKAAKNNAHAAARISDRISARSKMIADDFDENGQGRKDLQVINAMASTVNELSRGGNEILKIAKRDQPEDTGKPTLRQLLMDSYAKDA